MREILYRAKVKDKNELIGKGFPIDENGNLKSEWVFGVPIPHYPDLFLAWNEACNEYEEVTIIPETVSQYTGLQDKNGKKIFEGDIVKMSYRGDVLTAVVRFGNYNQPDKILKTHLGFYFDFDTVNFEDCRKDVGYWTGRTFGEIEVIGNIYDDLDLIKA